MQHCPHRRLQQSRHLNDLVPALASVVHHQPARGGVCRPHEGPRAAEEDGSNSILKDLRSAVTPWHDVAAIATGYMNKSQSIDGIIGPHHANGLPRSVALKAEAAQSVRRVYKNIIAQELNNMEEQDLDDMTKDCPPEPEEVDLEVLDFENNHGQHGDGAKLRHLVADVQKIMADAKVL